MASSNRRPVAVAAARLVESLEARQHLHADVDLTVAFSPAGTNAGSVVADHGDRYGVRTSGNAYGWASDERDQTRTRNKLSNKTLDSFIHVKARWDMAIANGQFKVTLTSGDANYFDSTHVIDVEGVRVMNGTVTAKKPFRTESGIVNVTDGKLTLRPGSMGQNVKLNSIRIQSTHEETKPTVSMTVTQSEAREQPTSAAQYGMVLLTRAGSTSAPLRVNLAWSGSAGSKDIVSRPSVVEIPAGSATLAISVIAKTDNVSEKAESAVVTLTDRLDTYTIGSPKSASIRVANNDTVKAKHIVSVVATTSTATEGGSDGVFTFTRRAGDLNDSVTVLVDWSGSAGAADVDVGTDDTTLPSTVVFESGSATAVLTVKATVDSLVESNETATVTITSPNDRYDIENPASASITVVSTDAVASRNQLTWTSVANAPEGLSEGQTAVVNNLFYRFGGYRDNTFVPSRKAERYNPATNTWQTRADMPIGFTHSATAVVGTTVWFAGAYEERVGVAGQQNIGTTRVLIYDTVANTWSDGPSLPEARGSGGMELIDNKLYFTSGERLSDRANVGTTWMYDLGNTNASWQTRAEMPSPRSHFGTATVNGILYVVGGQTGAGGNGVPLKTVYAYNPGTNAWTQKPDLPTAMSHGAPATLAFEGKIYRFGGDNPADVAQSQVIEYNPADGTSRVLASLPGARLAGLAGVIDGDTFIFTSGYDFQFRSDTWIGTWS